MDARTLTTDMAKPLSASTLSHLAAPLWVRPVLAAVVAGWRIGTLTFTTPAGEIWSLSGTEPGPHAQIIVHNWAFVRAVARGGDIGLAESYQAGLWSSPDLEGMLHGFSRNLDHMHHLIRGNWLTRALGRVQHALRRNTRAGARANIHAHYDLGNAFYALWLDAGMTYSAARFQHPAQALQDAQDHKYATLAHMLHLKPGDHVLEIGSGWGGFACYLARQHKVRVTSLTISQAQHAYATARVAREGLADRVEIRLQDYRDITGQFEAVVSVEMFEAVGEAYWPAYFQTIQRVLKPGGRAGLQIITIREDLFARYRRRADFIQKYIFPGGMLPTVSRLRDITAAAGVPVADVVGFGADYARTLHLWDQQFQAASPRLLEMGYDIAFQRLWRFYLCYCAAGFHSGRTDVVHVALQKS